MVGGRQPAGRAAQDLDVDVTWILLSVEFGGDLRYGDAEETWRGHCDLGGLPFTRHTIYVGRRGGTWLIGSRDSSIDRIIWRAEPHPTKEAAMATARTALLARLAQRALEQVEDQAP